MLGSLKKKQGDRFKNIEDHPLLKKSFNNSTFSLHLCISNWKNATNLSENRYFVRSVLSLLLLSPNKGIQIRGLFLFEKILQVLTHLTYWSKRSICSDITISRHGQLNVIWRICDYQFSLPVTSLHIWLFSKLSGNIRAKKHDGKREILEIQHIFVSDKSVRE